MREQLIAKLRPDRFTAMSGKMAAIVGYILDERFSEPAISELVVTSDGFVLAQAEGEVGANEMLGSEVDLNRNLLELIAAAGLTTEGGPRVRPAPAQAQKSRSPWIVRPVVDAAWRRRRTWPSGRRCCRRSATSSEVTPTRESDPKDA